MHLTFAFSPTTLVATIWDGLEVVASEEVAFRDLHGYSLHRPYTSGAIVEAIEKALIGLTPPPGTVNWAPLSRIHKISGTVPHPTTVSVPASFEPRLQTLDPTRSLRSQFDSPDLDLEVLDVFNPRVAEATFEAVARGRTSMALGSDYSSEYSLHVSSDFGMGRQPSYGSQRNSQSYSWNGCGSTSSGSPKSCGTGAPICALGETGIDPSLIFPGTLPAHTLLTPSATRVAPIGYILSSLLLQASGAVSEEEYGIFLGRTGSNLSSAESDQSSGAGCGSLFDVDRVRDAALPAQIVGADETLGELGWYWRERFGFGHCVVLPFIPAAFATHWAVGTGPGDILVLHDTIDSLVLPLPRTVGDDEADREARKVPGCSIVIDHLAPDYVAQHGSYAHVVEGRTSPHPRWQTRPKVAITHDPNGAVARHLVKNKYANGRWEALGHLGSRFPSGGALGHDNKLFAFVQPYPAPGLTSPIPGTTRFERGTTVTEFRDLRANTRCILECQALALRSQALSLGVDIPERVVVVGNEGNVAVPHILSQVFNCDVYAAESKIHLPSLGAVLVASGDTFLSAAITIGPPTPRHTKAFEITANRPVTPTRSSVHSSRSLRSMRNIIPDGTGVLHKAGAMATNIRTLFNRRTAGPSETPAVVTPSPTRPMSPSALACRHTQSMSTSLMGILNSSQATVSSVDGSSSTSSRHTRRKSVSPLSLPLTPEITGSPIPALPALPVQATGTPRAGSPPCPSKKRSILTGSLGLSGLKSPTIVPVANPVFTQEPRPISPSSVVPGAQRHSISTLQPRVIPAVPVTLAAQRPPSPAPSDTQLATGASLRLVAPKPKDQWEHNMYKSMLPEYLRLRSIVNDGLVTPRAIF